MNKEHRTIKYSVTAELTEGRSRFVASLFPVSTASEAMKRFSQVCKKFRDAKHNVYAYVLVSGESKFSDCGEPGGTAGRPIFEVLSKKRLFDVVAVVSRYFGGILLGRGGLVRSYSGVVAKALVSAEIVNMVVCDYCRVECDYGVLARTLEILENYGVFLESKKFHESVALLFYSDVSVTLNLRKCLRDISSGATKFEILGRKMHNLDK